MYFEPLLKFFDGLNFDENRLRWDRLITLHLILMSFLNRFGYKIQKSSKEQLYKITITIKSKEIIQNLLFWLEKLGLNKETKDLRKVLKEVLQEK